MKDIKKLQVSFKAPLQVGDTDVMTVGCRANNPDICANNGLDGVCAFVSEDGLCRKPSRAWKKQYEKLRNAEVKK